jgi:hypothetical protein
MSQHASQDHIVRGTLAAATVRAGATVVGDVSDPSSVRLLIARGDHTADLRVTRALVGASRWRLSAHRSGASAELLVRPELAGEGLDKLLGMTIDLDTGDAAFDARFVTEAAPPAVARHVLDGALRAAMLALPVSDDGPALRLDDRTLAVAWTGSVGVDALASVIASFFDALEQCRALHEALGASGLAPFRESSGGSAAVDPATRADARARIGRARRKAVAFVASAAVVAAAFLASVVTVGR